MFVKNAINMDAGQPHSQRMAMCVLMSHLIVRIMCIAYCLTLNFHESQGAVSRRYLPRAQTSCNTVYV